MKQKSKGRGLTLHRGTWHVIYYIDGKQKQKNTKETDLELAKKYRDEFLKDAVIPKRKYMKVGENTYIYKTNAYTVKVRGNYVGRYATYEEAKEARDEFLAGL